MLFDPSSNPSSNGSNDSASANQESDVASLGNIYPLGPPGLVIPDGAVIRGATSSDHHNPIDENDIVIAVMGLTGAGKSSFINTAVGKSEVAIGNDLNSRTQAVKPVRCLHPDGRRNIVLVDTPGFDDTRISDTEILRIIANWLNETYRNSIKLTGLLYLHRISDVRMAGTPLRNLSVFKDLCGDDSLKNIVLVTTMWDEIQDQSVGSKREEELFADFWDGMIRLGSSTCRFEGNRNSAWEIINRLDLEGSRQKRTALQIQQEMVERSLPLHETTAAKTLFRFLLQFPGECKKIWGKLRRKVRGKSSLREPSGVLQLRPVPSRSSTIRSSSSGTSWSMVLSTGTLSTVSHDSTAPSTSAGSASSGCSHSGRQAALQATIKILGIAYEMAGIGHIPMLRGIIGTVMRIAQLIEEMGGTHHTITHVIESSGWLLDEITKYAVNSKLSKDMKRALGSFQTDLSKLQTVVTTISRRGRFARFFLHDSDIQAIAACTTSINAVYDKLEVKLAMDNRQAIARLEDQLTALCNSTTLRQCECGMALVPRDESQENDTRPLLPIIPQD